MDANEKIRDAINGYVGHHNIRGITLNQTSVTFYHNGLGVPPAIKEEIAAKLPNLTIFWRQKKYRVGTPLPKTFRVRHR